MSLVLLNGLENYTYVIQCEEGEGGKMRDAQRASGEEKKKNDDSGGRRRFGETVSAVKAR